MPLESLTQELVGLAQRGTSHLDPRKSWLPLLQCLLKLNSHDLLKQVLANADLNLTSELHLLMEHTNGTLGDLRSLIMGLFDKCKYEIAMLKSTSRVHYQDIHNQLEKALKEANRGQLAPSTCTVCDLTFNSQLTLFRCGHGYHSNCIEAHQHCIQCYKPEIPG